MKFVVINPKLRKVSTVEALDFRSAVRDAGLDPDTLDHGAFSRRVAYAVYEFGLFTPPAEQHYFGFDGRLIAGTAVLYGVGEAGETVDLMASAVPTPRFYLGQNDVESDIAMGIILRPEIAVNGERIWAWPQPAPKGFSR
jgi:hypothetical protein